MPINKFIKANKVGLKIRQVSFKRSKESELEPGVQFETLGTMQDFIVDKKGNLVDIVKETTELYSESDEFSINLKLKTKKK